MAKFNLVEMLRTPTGEHIPVEILALLHIIGHEVVVDGEGIDVEHSFPNASDKYWLNICSDNVFGPVAKATVLNGHLVLTASFGEDGDYHFSFTHPSREWEVESVYDEYEFMTIINISTRDVQVTCTKDASDIYLEYLLS